MKIILQLKPVHLVPLFYAWQVLGVSRATFYRLKKRSNVATFQIARQKFVEAEDLERMRTMMPRRKRRKQGRRNYL